MRRRGQGILEYILLTALVAFVSLLFFRTGLVDRTVVASNDYFKTGARAIMGGYFDKTTGEAIVGGFPDAVDGGWCAFTKCINRMHFGSARVRGRLLAGRRVRGLRCRLAVGIRRHIRVRRGQFLSLVLAVVFLGHLVAGYFAAMVCVL